MLNQLISDENKKIRKKMRINDVCNNIISELDKEIDSNKKKYCSPSFTITKEKPRILTKGEKLIQKIQAKKNKNGIFMTEQDNKNSKRIQKLFSVEKNKAKPNLPQKIPQSQVQEYLKRTNPETFQKTQKQEKEKTDKKNVDNIEYDPLDFSCSNNEEIKKKLKI